MTAHSTIRLRAAAALAGLSLMLTGCFISPGKFTSELTLLENDQFTFTYEGEVYFLGLSRWVKMQQEQSRPKFRAYCYGPVEEGDPASEAAEAVVEAVEEAAEAIEITAEETADAAAVETIEIVETAAMEDAGGSRDCTAEEEAEQRERWEERQERRLERDRQQMEQFSKLIGGIDPADPNAEAELAKILMRQKGFDRVEAKGDGMFEISYSISGTLNHDYMFPMMEDFPTTNPFLQMFLRDGDVVRINAPGFAPQSVTSPVSPLLFGAPGFGRGSSDEFEALGDIPAVDGTFTIITTGNILANNTDEGPVTDAGSQRLTWTINGRSKTAPTALIAMPR